MKNFLKRCRGLVPIIVGLLMSLPLAAQTISVRGHVNDASGEPIIGASIKVKGATEASVTDIEGNFLLKTKSQSTLVVSYLGYKTQEVALKGRTNLTITLEEDASSLDEVVVIGYGQVKKSDATGSVIAIKPNTINRVKMTTTTDLLLGKVAGLQVTQGSGSAGQSGTVRIRQGASLNASNDPLVVIDGMVDASLSSVNPEDIEAISVLKDASASAIYGARGANGVIIVTTKKGPAKAGQAVAPKVSYRGDLSVNYNYEYLDVYKADEYREEYAKRGWDVNLLGSASTDWQKEITRTAFTQKHTVSMRGALPYLPYRVSLGFQEEQGIIIGNKQDVGTAAINLTPKFFKDHLSVDFAFKDTYKYSPESGGSLSSAASKDPTQPIYADYGSCTIDGVDYAHKAEGYYMYGADSKGDGADPNASNPVASANLPGTGYNANNRVVTNLTANYKLHGFEDLDFTFSFNGSYYNSHSVDKDRNNTPSTWSSSNVKLNKGGIGQNSKSSSYSHHYSFDYFLHYNHLFAKLHSVDATFGHSYESKYSSYTNTPTYYNDGEIVSGSVETSGKLRVNLSSWFGRLNYMFNDKYLFTFTMRSDASSRFAPETRWGNFPSAALAWKINEEKFIKKFDFVSDLKLRLSYGKTGQQEIGNDYAYQASYYASIDTKQYKEGGTSYTTYRPSAFNRAIQWEVTTTKNIGLDFGFLKNRITGSIDYYDRYTDNLLMSDVKVAAGSNFAEVADQNIGEMASRGLEFAISAIPVKTRFLQWTVSANISWNKSTIKKLTAYEDQNAYVKTGAASSNRYMQYHKVGCTPYTYFLAKQAYDEQGNPIEKFHNPAYDPNDPNSEEFVTDDSADASKWNTGKSSLAPYYGGFSTQVRYKNWDFGMNGHFAFGHYVFWKTMYDGCNSSFFNSSYQFPMNTYKIYTPYWEKEHYYSDYWLHRGDYLKLDNIVVGYTFSHPCKQIESMRLSLGVQNIFTITSYPGLDPEVYSGIDGSSTPRPRQMMLSLSIDL